MVYGRISLPRVISIILFLTFALIFWKIFNHGSVARFHNTCNMTEEYQRNLAELLHRLVSAHLRRTQVWWIFRSIPVSRRSWNITVSMYSFVMDLYGVRFVSRGCCHGLIRPSYASSKINSSNTVSRISSKTFNETNWIFGILRLTVTFTLRAVRLVGRKRHPSHSLKYIFLPKIEQ